jgi:hypothetical protein
VTELGLKPGILVTQLATAMQCLRPLRHLGGLAPVLIHLVLSRQIVVEVDTSDVGVGAVLSQCSAQNQKLHP